MLEAIEVKIRVPRQNASIERNLLEILTMDVSLIFVGMKQKQNLIFQSEIGDLVNL